MTIYKIRLGRDYYHRIHEITTWCEKNIGLGGWCCYQENMLFGDYKWDIEQLFGYTTFRFTDASDYSKFLVKWEWANGQDSTN